MPSPAIPARCFNHPDLPAIARCVRCGKAVCASCSTRWEGMHHCNSCLAAQRAAEPDRTAVARAVGLALLGLAVAGGVTLLLAIAGAILARAF
jgi:hypothetical protein